MIDHLVDTGFSVSRCCEVLGCSSQGYYAYRRRGLSPTKMRRGWLTAFIREVHGDSRGTYGSRRVRAELTKGCGCRKSIAAGHRVCGCRKLIWGCSDLVGAGNPSPLVTGSGYSTVGTRKTIAQGLGRRHLQDVKHTRPERCGTSHRTNANKGTPGAKVRELWGLAEDPRPAPPRQSNDAIRRPADRGTDGNAGRGYPYHRSTCTTSSRGLRVIFVNSFPQPAQGDGDAR